MVEIVKSCPLGHTCEQVKDGKIHRCPSYISLAGTDAQGNQVNEFRCSIFEWQPILLLEISATIRGNQAAIESFRNETVRGQENFLSLAQAAMQNRLKHGTDGTTN